MRMNTCVQKNARTRASGCTKRQKKAVIRLTAPYTNHLSVDVVREWTRFGRQRTHTNESSQILRFVRDSNPGLSGTGTSATMYTCTTYERK